VLGSGFAERYISGVTRVLIADDHGIVREGLRRLLEREADLVVCGEAADGEDLLEQIGIHDPEVVILDISMPKLGGLETLERVRRRFPAVKAILLSVHGDPPLVQSAVALGADGYLLKNGPAADVIEAVRAVVKGGSFFSPPIAKEIVAQLRTPQRGADPFSMLSGREREIVHLIADGLSAKEIAAALHISTKTVEAHRTSLMRKLRVRKATELVRYALRFGLVEP
jgi:DNA-binding NarL/FixJ family response regulator